VRFLIGNEHPRNLSFSHRIIWFPLPFLPAPDPASSWRAKFGKTTTDDDDGILLLSVLIMLLLWLLPLLFQSPRLLTTERKPSKSIIMSEGGDGGEWETIGAPSNNRRDRRRKLQRPPGQAQTAPMVSPLSANAKAFEAKPQENLASNDAPDVPRPFLLMLAGLPGCGKSTLAEKLLLANPNYVHINQDILGTRDKCLSAARNAIAQGKYPICDRCNFDATQRKWFVDLAHQLGYAVHCVVLNVDSKTCLERCRKRQGHPTLPPHKAGKVIGFLKRDWRLPTEKEGIDQIWIVNHDQQLQDVVAFYS
jgi:predicted kinase